MVGKTVIVTGANSGIGKAAACELAKREARVILACRDIDSAREAVREIKASTKSGELVVKKLDLASFESIKEFADEVQKEERIDVLINNAGIFQCPYSQTTDGLEMQMGVNHFGHFLLTNLLIDKLKASAPSRVVIVTSVLSKLGKIEIDNLISNEENYNKKAAYYNSKLATNLFARELAKRLDGTGVNVHCVSPGMVRTKLGRHVPIPKVMKLLLYPLAWLLTKSPWEGCQTVLYCSIADEVKDETGCFYRDCKREPWRENALDDEAARRLWEASRKVTGLQ